MLTASSAVAQVLLKTQCTSSSSFAVGLRYRDISSAKSGAVPLSDQNAWYYPSYGHDSDEEDLPVGARKGNWGHKDAKSARWIRRRKIAPWGPGMEDWEVSVTRYSISQT